MHSLAIWCPFVLCNKAMGGLQRILLSSIEKKNYGMLEYGLRNGHLPQDL